MKILVIPRVALPINFTPGGSNLGGAEKYVALLCNVLISQGHEVDTILLKNSISDCYERNFYGYQINKLGILENQLDDTPRASDKDLVEILSKINYDYDLIINNHNNNITILNLLKSKAKGKFVTYIHGTISQLSNRFLKWMSNNSDIPFVVNSKSNYDGFRNYGYKVHLNTLILEDETYIIDKLVDNFTNPRFKDIIALERTSGEKKPKLFRQISQYDLDHNYHLYDGMDRGDNWNNKYLPSTDNFEVKKPINHIDFYSILGENNSILFNRAYQESFGMSAAESLIAGRPVIAVDFPENNVPNLIRSCGTLIKSTDNYSLYDSGIILNNKLTPTEFSKYIKLALSELEEFYKNNTSNFKELARKAWVFDTKSHINNFVKLIK